MTKPKPNEPKEVYLHRFMADEQACREYPNEADRFERGATLWDKRELLEAANAMGYNSERDGAEAFGGRHIQPGVVNYPEMKNPLTGAKDIAILVEKTVLDAMRASMAGVPVVNWAHDMSGGAERWIKDGKAVGVVVGSHWVGEDAWDQCDFMLWDKEAKANARNGFSLSNAWKEDDIDWTPGIHNGVRYDGRLTAAHYTHLAIVPKPRYNGAVIFANSLGGIMKLFGFGKDEGVELSKDAALDVNGKKYPLAEIVNAIAAQEKVTSTAKDGVLGDKDSIEVGGKKYSLAEVANALALADKAKVAAPELETPVPVEAKPVHETPEFINAVGAIVKATLDKAVGDGFFNGIKALAERRPSGEETKPVGRATERERVAQGKARFGRREKAQA